MKKAKRIILWIFLGTVVVIGLGLGLLCLKRDWVKQTAVNEINKQLQAPFAVGPIDISLRKFPSASLVFKDVYSPGVNSSQTDTLIFAKRIYLEFDLWQTLFDQLTIDKVSLEDATIHLKQLNDGDNNYTVWSNDSANGASIFSLKDTELKNVQLSYWHQPSKVYVQNYIKNHRLKGAFTGESIELENSGEWVLDQLKVKDKDYIQEVSAAVSFILKRNSETLSLENGESIIDGLPINFSLNQSGTFTELQFNSEKLSLKEAYKLILNQNWISQNDIQLDGKLDVSGTAKFGKKQSLESSFTLKQVKLKGQEVPEIKSIDANGTYSLKNKRGLLSIENYTANMASGNLYGNGSLTTEKHPLAKLSIAGELDFSEWLNLASIDTLENPQGKLSLNIHLEDRIKSPSKLQVQDLTKATINGKATLSDIGFTITGENKAVKNLRGSLTLKNHILKFQNLYFKRGKSDLYTDGELKNPLRSLLIADQPIQVKALIKSQEIQLEDFLFDLKSDEDIHPLEVANRLSLDLQIESDKLSFKKFKAKDLRGLISIKRSTITARNVQMKANSGSYNTDFTIDPSHRLKASISLTNVDIEQLFRSFENFGQDQLTNKNIDGTLSARFRVNGNILKDLGLASNTLVANGDFEIKNGEIKDYEPAKALSKYADIKELKHIKFSNLKQQITIQNEVISIPSTHIQSNVLNMDIEGTHSFSNQVNYSIRLKLGDVLFTKKKKQKRSSEFDDYIVEKSADNPYIYIRMKGAANQPEISLDKGSISKSIGKELKQQGSEIKELFKKETPKSEEETKESDLIFEWNEEDDPQ